MAEHKKEGAVLLLAHGSLIDPGSSKPCRALAEQLRRRGRIARIGVGFWQEPPSIRRALLTLDAERVTVFPFFMADGYFTKIVLPHELGLTGAVDVPGHIDAANITLLPPLGATPQLDEIVIEIAEIDDQAPPALVLVGHGTRRSPTSADTLYAMVDRLRLSGRFASVEAAFLDQEPRLTGLREHIESSSSPVVVVPFMTASGYHTTVDIPAQLEGCAVRVTAPLGEHPKIAEIVEGALEEATEAARAPTIPPRGALQALASLPDGPSRFGEIVIDRIGDRFTLRHADHDPATGQNPTIDPTRDADGHYRALRFAPGLDPGLSTPSLEAVEASAALEALYPGQLSLWFALARGEVAPVTLEAFADSQTGRRSGLADVEPGVIERARRRICGSGCLCRCLWHNGGGRGTDQRTDALELVCVEPCPFFIKNAQDDT